LKTELEETKRIEEVILKQLNDKKKNCEKLEVEIVVLKRELEKGKNHLGFENNSKNLKNILTSKISPSNKTVFGYDTKEF
jgi:hypothetical protein